MAAPAGTTLASTTSTDQEKFLAARLIQRAMLKLVAATACDPIKQPEGMGLTANFVRYQRMNVPLATLTEGSPPANNTISLQSVTVTLDQWGDVVTLTDVTQLTTKHPLMQQVIELLSDNAMRVIDREIQIVWLAGTNVQYFDGSVAARSSLTAQSKINDTVLHKARVTMLNNGAPPRGGPAGGIILAGDVPGSTKMGGDSGQLPTKSAKGMEGLGYDGDGAIKQGQNYVMFCTPNVSADIQQASTSFGSWVATAMYQNQKALYNGEVGTWLGFRVIESNFLPVFQLLGNTTIAVNSGASFGTDTPVVTDTSANNGSLVHQTTYYFYVTKKDQLRGFEEFISIEHTITTANDANDAHTITFNFANLTAGFVWNLYFGSSTGRANSFLVQANITGGSVVVGTVPTTGANPPVNAPTGVPVHRCYIHGAESTNWVGLQNLQVFVSYPGATTVDPLAQLRTIGYKYLGKAMIRDQLRLLGLEVASTY